MVLRAETLAAGTGTGGVRIADFEAAFLQSIYKVQFAAGHIKSALGIDDHTDAAAFNEDIAIGRLILQIHLVLQTRATAADDRDAQHAIGPALFLQKGTDFLRRRRANLDQALVADSKVGGRGGIGRSLSSSNHALA